MKSRARVYSVTGGYISLFKTLISLDEKDEKKIWRQQQRCEERNLVRAGLKVALRSC